MINLPAHSGICPSENPTFMELIEATSHRGDEVYFVVISDASSVLDVVKRSAIDEYGDKRLDPAILIEHLGCQGRKGPIGAGKNLTHSLAGNLKRRFPVHTFTHHSWNIDSGHVVPSTLR